jgi:lipoprotein Spr
MTMKPGSKFILLFSIIFVWSCKHHEKEVHAKIEKKRAPVAASKPSKRRINRAAATDLAKIGITTREIGESKLYSFVNDWYGTPYKYSGCQRTGIDCSCFSNLLYEKVYDKKIPRTTGEMYAICKKINLDDAREGDLVFFKIGGNAISHVGVYLKKKHFVHSSSSRGVMVSSMDEPYFKKYFYCAGKLRNS